LRVAGVVIATGYACGRARRSVKVPALLEDPSGEKPAVLTAKVPALLVEKDPSGEKPAVLTAKVPALLVEKDPSWEALLAAKVPALLEDPSGEKPALLAAIDPSGEKPALAAKVPVLKWETHVHGNPATAIPALRNSVRWFHDCQRGHRYEQCDALQHDSLLYLSAPPHLTLQAHTSNRNDSIGGW